jgi:acetylornithine deacetylase/succinyl-diaminopimelate desuccinylase-like protein
LNFDELRDETIRHLRALLRIDTSNPPGNESLAVAYLAEILTQEGIPFITPERRAGRANLIARLKGDGSAAPLLLMGHTDVVPAEAALWEHPPFSADISDGHIWGRGALDMKFMVAYELAVFLVLHRSGRTLNRDVILAATADEEIAQGNGIDWLAAKHPDLIRADFAINELGATTSWMAGRPIYGIQVAEKGVCWLRLTIRGQPGHASIPRRDNPISALAAQVTRLDRYRPAMHITDTMRTYLTGIAQVLGTDYDTLLHISHDLDAPNPLESALVDDERRNIYAQTHNTAVPTGVTGGYKTNVIPSVAVAEIDGRTLPGFDTDAYLHELRGALGSNVEIDVFSQSPPLEVPHDTPLFRLMQQTLERLHPGALALPTMMVGATDAKFLEPLGIKVYGFSPVRFEQGAPGAELIHSHNERIPVDGLAFGVRALYEVVSQFVGVTN